MARIAEMDTPLEEKLGEIFDEHPRIAAIAAVTALLQQAPIVTEDE
jgi:hypothetical protein